MKQIYFTFIAIIILIFGCKKEDSVTNPEDTKVEGSVTYNGYTYQIIKIGTQEWTVENLRTTFYNDGSPIMKVSDKTEWSTLETGAYSVYDNNEINLSRYGCLYNWYAINTGKLAPITGGWRVPTHSDWTKLTNYLGGKDSAGIKLKAKSGWYNNGNGTDKNGFNALPGGNRDFNGNFNARNNIGTWWTSTAYSSLSAWLRIISYDETSVNENYFDKNWGFSVRLVRDLNATNSSPLAPSNPLPATGSTDQATYLKLSWNCSDPDGDDLSYNVYFDTTSIPTTLVSEGQSVSTQSLELKPSTTYFWKVVAKDGKGGISESPVWSFKASSLEVVTGTLEYNGFTYKTVKFGTLEWTVENLQTRLYNDGTAITKITDGTEWLNLSTGAYCAYNNDETNLTNYGYLYNWYAVNSGKLAPSTGGWRVPTDEDWTKITNYIGGPINAGSKLKAKSGWYNNWNGTDDFGFSAFPAGNRDSYNGNFYSLGLSAIWWSSSAFDTIGAWISSVRHNSSYIYRNSYNKKDGFSVRLVRDL